MDMQDCGRQRATLSKAACARMWEAAQAKRPEPWESKRNCVGCPIGARNAGKSAPEARADTCAEALRGMCPGCSENAGRLINGRHCVSCYNRRREVAAGVNAKGGRPRLLKAMHTERLVAAPAGGRVAELALENVASRTEAMILAAKRAGGPVAFQRAPVRLPPGCTFDLPL